MFSGKSTELIRRIEREESIGRKVVLINHLHDARRSGEGFIQTHSGKKKDCKMVESIKEFRATYNDILEDVQTIAINEGQFFVDLEFEVLKLVDMGYNVIVCGLDTDFHREPFMEIVRLIPHADNVIRTTAFCSVCRDGKTEAIYSARIIGGTERVLVGGSDSYQPVCRGCYRKVSCVP
jgi:thymidine kinase